MTEETTGQQAGAEQETTGSEFKPITSQEELNKLIGARINSVKSQYADYDDIKAKAAKYDEVEQANKSELQKLQERAEAAERERDSIRLDGIRAQVALAKGLTPSQAKRLVGSAKEELEADADDLLADLGGTKSEDKPTPSRRPTEHLRGGGDPEEDPEVDLRKIADQIPRR